MPRISYLVSLAALLIAPSVLGCGGTDTEADTAGSTSGMGGAGSTSVGTTVSSSTGITPGLVAIPGVSMAEIAIYQAVKRPLMVDGGPASSTIPLVAGRDALIRVYVSLDGSYDGTAITAQLTLQSGSVALETTLVPLASSSDDNLESTINFELPGAAVDASFAYQIALGRPSETGEPAAPLSYPVAGFDAAPGADPGSNLHVELIPLLYGADGSNRPPDTSPEQLDLIRNHLLGVFPVPDVELTLHAEVPYASAVLPTGQGWQDLIDFVAALRAQDNPAYEVFYFGLINPTDDLSMFCNPSCTVGKGREGPVGDPSFQVAVGVGFTGDHTALTVRHEMGHTFGRHHAPCKATDLVDPEFPNADGSIGVWGYDPANVLLLPPDTPDMMGNCKPNWVSDYTFTALFDRLVASNAAK